MTILTTLRTRLHALADPQKARVAQSFFKTGAGQYGEGDRFLGIRVPPLRALAAEFGDASLDDLTAMLESPWHEERLLAMLIMVRQYARGDEQRKRELYDAYLANTARINNWDLVDCSAEHVVGAHLAARSRSQLTKLARSKSLWERRIAIISTFHFIRRGEFAETLRIARMLIRDEHDLIHKAVGWMLREVGKRHLAAERAFLDEHAAEMPRTMLRYAIERFPAALRAQYMAARS